MKAAAETIGVVTCFLGVLFLLIFLLYYSHYIKARLDRRRESAFDRAAAEFYSGLRRVQGVSSQPLGMFPSGLTRASVDSYPVLIVERGTEWADSREKSCPICLSDYLHRETLKILPNCLHRFHSACVDQWLRTNATCPICRVTLPSLSATPDTS